MGDKSGISWTDATWNPIFGCSKVSPGCAHCYAETFALTRMKGKREYTGLPWTPENAEANVQLRPARLDQPLRWKRPRRIFVNSLSDLFHERVPDDFILQVFDVMRRSTYNGGAGAGTIRDAEHEGHVFQVLTKRPERMAAFVSRLRWDGETLHLDGGGSQFTDPAIWLGTSVENQHWADIRIPQLLDTPAAVRFLSCEPLLGEVDLDRMILSPHVTEVRGCLYALRCSACGAPDAGPYCTWCGHGQDVERPSIDWVIVGGESGPGHRPMEAEWVDQLREQCAKARVPFFMKQTGATLAQEMGLKQRKGDDPAEWPEKWRVQQWP